MRAFNMKVLLLTVAWHENDGGVDKKQWGDYKHYFCAMANLCHIRKGNFAKLN